MNKHDNIWRIWDNEKEYGERFVKRIKGELPEMESSKALAKTLKDEVNEYNKILDVGCGTGHYLASLLKAIDHPFSYTGVDATRYYVDLAIDTWKGIFDDAKFVQGDIFNLPFEDNSFDVVYCCNVLLHLPSVEIPIKELIRVAKRLIIVRSLFSDRSFRVMDVHKSNNEEYLEFDINGQPKSFHYYNIYSKDYINDILKKSKVNNVEFKEDTNFNANAIQKEFELFESSDQTHMLDGYQVNGCIIQPWHFLKIKL